MIQDLKIELEIAEKIKELLKDYLHQVTIKSDDDKDTKLINLTAKNPYSFDPRLIYKQIDGYRIILPRHIRYCRQIHIVLVVYSNSNPSLIR